MNSKLQKFKFSIDYFPQLKFSIQTHLRVFEIVNYKKLVGA